jgi:hypothetical protein
MFLNRVLNACYTPYTHEDEKFPSPGANVRKSEKQKWSDEEYTTDDIIRLATINSEVASPHFSGGVILVNRAGKKSTNEPMPQFCHIDEV